MVLTTTNSSIHTVTTYIQSTTIRKTDSNSRTYRRKRPYRQDTFSTEYRRPRRISTRSLLRHYRNNKSKPHNRTMTIQAMASSTTINKSTRQKATFDTDSYTIAIDGCASACMTPTKSDFISPPQRCSTTVNGMGGDSQATFRGTVRWHVDDDNGRRHSFVIPNTCYAPTAPFRLLSPQHLAQAYRDPAGTGADTNGVRCRLYWQNNKYQRNVPLDSRSNVAIIRSSPGYTRYRAYAAVAATTHPEPELRCYPVHVIPDDDDSVESPSPPTTNDIPIRPSVPHQTTTQREGAPTTAPPTTTTTTETNTAPTVTPPDIVPFEFDDLPDAAIRPPPEPELQDPHKELMRWHCKLGHLPFSRIRLLALKGDLPASILKVKSNDTPFCAACQYGKATKRPRRTKGVNNRGKIRTATAPAQIVSVDQMESSTAGLIAQLKGKPTTARFRYATVFVDHFSRLSYVHLQPTLTSVDTLKAKHAFERYCINNGAGKVAHYHADNGRFADNMRVHDANKQGQTTSYCGVNAHFQNGIAEKRIRDLQEAARTMLAYAKHRWPDAITANLWPYAYRTANDVHNSTPLIDKQRSPLSLFTQTDVRCNLKHFQPFGCPVYILDNALQAGSSLPKWNDRARVGINLGHSKSHASSVGLILNTQTGLASPQYHVKYDRYFKTVNEPSTKLVRWQIATGFVEDTDRTKGPTTPTHATRRADRTNRPATPSVTSTLPTTALEGAPTQDLAPVDNNTVATDNTAPSRGPTEETQTPVEPAITTRSGRQRKETTRARESRQQRDQGIVAWWTNVHQEDDEYEVHAALEEQEHRLQQEMEQPIAFAATADKDTMHYGPAMKAPDAPQFREAMKKEIDAHANFGHWKVVPKHTVPKGTRILDAVWSMKRKRRIDTQEVYRHKARLTVHGGQQQQGINFWETYSPVVSWPVIRLFLTMTLLHGWHSRQIDFVLAFPQADVETDIYMKLPAGYHRNDADPTKHCLKLIKNVYGTKQGPRTSNKFLHNKLEAIGFEQSKIEPCLYTRGPTAFLVYVDDGIVVAPTPSQTEQVLEDLMQAGMDVEDLGSIQDYLGVRVETFTDGKMKLAQPQLIDSILDDLHFKDNMKGKPIPAATTATLDHDLQGKPFGGEFHYRRVIGKLNFLEKSTLPDIAYAVHQCARFSTNPKESHTNAVRNIGRYLQQTRDKGLILDPKQQSFDCYVDADLAGLWNPATAAYDPVTSKSRTGFAITYGGCPISWQSKLQTITALSTSEAELIALSTALREVIPLMEVVREAKQRGFPFFADAPRVHCRAFEDNSGALEIAREYCIRPRTKHINIRYHHFRAHVRRKEISIHPIGTEDQID